jgi:predicted AAA+ superfamily ATPase
MGELGTPAGNEGDGGDFFSRVRELALESDNPFTLAAERGESSGSSLKDGNEAAAKGGDGPGLLNRLAAADLNRLGRIAAFDLPALGFGIALCLRSCGLEEAARDLEAEARELWRIEGRRPPGGDPCREELFNPPAGGSRIPGQQAGGGGAEGRRPWGDSLESFAAHIRRQGAGLLSRRGFFRWAPPLNRAGPGKLRPVSNGDPVSLADLYGYRDQRSMVMDNTLSFLEGKAANNLLLYGDRGTGKSATVKAVCREYRDRGLRLLELRKEDMGRIPAVMEFTASRGLKFIIFIDDLSFEGLDDSFTRLKALLEGGVEARPPNTLIYATSNRRHLVRERQADRPGEGEVRSFDTMQEQLSLSDRFGLTVFFTSPSQEEFLETARFIAEKRGLRPDEKFRENALRWEKWFNGRSPRTASQFAAWLGGGKPFPWEPEFPPAGEGAGHEAGNKAGHGSEAEKTGRAG